MKTRSHATAQQGSTLLEALVAILIFSMGVLALISLQAVSIKNSIDAKYRADASYLANQIVAQMWVDRVSIGDYEHYATTDDLATCALSGGPSSNDHVTDWLLQIAKLLPGAAANKAQILVDDVGTTKQVKVTVCWQAPQETTAHNFVVTAQINP